MTTTSVPSVTLGGEGGVPIKRLLIGLWQVADLEREGGLGLDRAAALADLKAYADAGLTTFDMADHYGSAEELIGALGRSDVVPLTKWVPKPGAEHATAEAVDAAVRLACTRLGLESVPLMQFHTWDYLDGPGRWLRQLRLLADHARVGHVGLTNVDAEHLRLALAEGLPVVSNQVCFSLLDRRARDGAMGALCARRGVRLLAFGVLAGGLLTDGWLGKPPPSAAELDASWSLAKYYRFVPLFEEQLLRTLRAVADARGGGATVAAVATRWVLDQRGVGGVIVGARLGRSCRLAEHLRPFELGALRADEAAAIEAVLRRSGPIPGDCGDEYRRRPFLTASGDLSHHLSTVPAAFVATPMDGGGSSPSHHHHHEEGGGGGGPSSSAAAAAAVAASSGSGGCPRLVVDSVWEGIARFSRATRVGNTIRVSGTTATSPLDGRCVGGADAAAQTTFALDVVEAALKVGLPPPPPTHPHTRTHAHTHTHTRTQAHIYPPTHPPNHAPTHPPIHLHPYPPRRSAPRWRT